MIMILKHCLYVQLDMRIRICIRDSLFRLAQSAMQRQCTSDTSSINRSGRDDHEVIMAEEINRNRSVHDQFSSHIPLLDPETIFLTCME